MVRCRLWIRVLVQYYRYDRDPLLHTNLSINRAAQFIEEEGYEPPQGFLKQISMTVGDNEETEEDSQFQITSSRWLLSEDPDDRKDGLWVSAFETVLCYPCCYPTTDCPSHVPISSIALLLKGVGSF